MIQTKVARVVSPTELVLAAGADDGVEEGMEFIVYSLSDIVFDPETSENLGQIEVVKARVIAAHVQAKMTTARTRSKAVKRIVDPLATMAEAMNPFQRREVSELFAEKMAVERAEALPATDLVVRVGDPVRSVYTPATRQQKEVAVA